MNRSVALEKIKTFDERYHIFEYEVGLTNKKQCIIKTFDEYMVLLINGVLRFWHELIYPNQPCRLFLDCEKTLKDGDVVDQSAYILGIHELMQTQIPDKLLPTPLIICATRESKFSVHLIWDFWMRTPGNIHAIAKVVGKTPLQGVTVDLQVYPMGDKPTTLRMPFCNKKTENCMLLPEGHTEFDPEVFCKHLLTFTDKASNKWPLPKRPTELYGEPLESKKKQRIDGEVTADKRFSALRWLALTAPMFKPMGADFYSDGSWDCHSSLFCAHLNKWHNSNKTYLHCDSKGILTACCADIECRFHVPFAFTARQVEVSETPVELNWTILNAVYATKKQSKTKL